MPKTVIALKDSRGALAIPAASPRASDALADTLGDLDTRIANVEKSIKDEKYLEIELERIEGKAQALAEVAITRQDPTELAAQVTAFTDTPRRSAATPLCMR